MKPKANYVLRLLGLALGFLANFIALGLAYDRLGLKEFGQLAVILNCAFLVQGLDLGVVPTITNTVGRAASGAAKSAGLRWLIPMTTSAAAVSAATFAVTVVLIPAVQSELLAWSLGAATLARILNGFPAQLVGLNRTAEYHAVLLLQPVALIVGAGIVHQLDAGIGAFAAAIILSVAAPGVGAAIWLKKIRINPEGNCDTGTTVSVGISPALGLRQLMSLVGFGLLPLMGLAVGGEALAAEYAIPFRLYVSAWSIIGVVYVTNWGRMAYEVERGNPSVRVRAVSRAGVIVAAPLAFAMVIFVEPVSRAIGSGLGDDSKIVTVVLAAALVLRASVLGEALRLQAGGITLRFALVELLAIGAAVYAPFAVGRTPDVLLPAFSVMSATIVSALLMRLAQRQRRSAA